ncbi:hypothetical protein SCAB_44261 [Streptomyces scabiei 87.22]|uniref:Uncharacterized protein n=1 Tax=Streptomyces scabiei (strain 87.22) TaxID=680198 RepID=C9Z795_STRSW|nr:hypothetical protein SCAB_44261 [Streptomyces scabiei 87.22]
MRLSDPLTWPYPELLGVTGSHTTVRGGEPVTDGRVKAAVRRDEMPMLRTYRLWFEHTRRCDRGCNGIPKAQDGCEAGQELWGAYRLARIGRGGAS